MNNFKDNFKFEKVQKTMQLGGSFEFLFAAIVSFVWSNKYFHCIVDMIERPVVLWIEKENMYSCCRVGTILTAFLDMLPCQLSTVFKFSNQEARFGKT